MESYCLVIDNIIVTIQKYNLYVLMCV